MNTKNNNVGTKKKKSAHLSSNINNKNIKLPKIMLLPIIMTLTVLPLIVRAYYYDNNLSSFNWFSSDEKLSDFFLYNKQIFFISISVILIILFVLQFKHIKKLKKDYRIFIPLLIYLLLAILSTILSPYIKYIYKGTFGQYQSIFSIIGYCLMSFYAYNVVNTEDDLKLIFKYFKLGIAALIIIGLFQITGNDLYRMDFMKSLILSNELKSLGTNVDIDFGLSNVALSLFNPNYVGVYTSLIIPIILIPCLSVKNIKSNIINYILLLGLAICLLASKSSAGLIATIISLIITCIFYRKQLIKYKKITIPLLFIILTFGIIYASRTNIYYKLNNIFVTESVSKPLSSIETNDDHISIVYNNNKLIILFLVDNGNFNGFIFTDEYGTLIESENSPESPLIYKITDERFMNFVVEPVIYSNILSFTVTFDGFDWVFTNQTPDGTYSYVNKYGKFEKIVKTPSANIFKNESIASGRGYIWNTTIPLLKHTLFLGTGADSYLITYPKGDYVGFYNNGFINQILTKPHSIYLQIGVETGVISLLAYIIFCLLYVINSVKIYVKSNFDTYSAQLGLGIFIGTISYFITGLTNDSTLCTAPIFWTLIGIGLAVNYKVKTESAPLSNKK